MLEYENQLLLDVVDESRLFIFAKGIEIQKVLLNLFRVYGTESHLVLVLSASDGEESYFTSRLRDEEKHRVGSITSEVSAGERKELYASGGVYFITARILIVDFLKEVVPAEKISGIIIFRAHNVLESSQEAFILRLFRLKNKTGFIRCFSHSPTSFLLGFSRVSAVMRSSFIPNLSLWPRSHSALKDSLQDSDPDSVVEILLNLTEEMREIQSNLLDLVTWTLSELKRLVPPLQDEDVSVETALGHGFEKLVRNYIEPIWNSMDSKIKENLNDLKLFRLLLTHLTHSDCITFYSLLLSHTSHEAAFRSSWVLSASADKIISAAKLRLQPTKKVKKKGDKAKEKGENNEKNEEEERSGGGKFKIFAPEAHPKWLAVGEILKEIETQKYQNIPLEKDEGVKEEDDKVKKTEKLRNKTKRNKKNADSVTENILSLEENADSINSSDDDGESEGDDMNFLSKSKTIIFAQDYKTCSALRDYLTYGKVLALGKILRNSENIKMELPPEVIQRLNNISREKKGERERSENQTTLTQIERNYETQVKFMQHPVFIRAIKDFDTNVAYGHSEALSSLRPDNIIIFDPDLELIRNIEIYKARVGTTQKIRVYFLVFRNSIEEQIYLTEIQREKLGFEKLIDEKNKMVVPNEREGKDDLNQDLWRDPTKASQILSLSSSSRRNMEKNNEGEVESILVDMREFRSELPSLIHKRGIELEPLTLDVGDYILTPEICVERKSLSDLIGSLNSGRLYKQAEAMGRHYAKPVLLIEHETKGSYRYKNDLMQIMPKLQLLTVNFPKLKIIWTPGSHYTAEIFHELKKGKPQPSGEEALRILKDSSGSHSTSRFNSVAHSFLSKLPGVDSGNIYKLLNGLNSLDELVKLNESELCTILENKKSGELLYKGLHSKITGEEMMTTKTKVNPKFRQKK